MTTNPSSGPSGLGAADRGCHSPRSEATRTRREMLRLLAGAGAALLAPSAATAWPLAARFRGIDQRHLWIAQAGRHEAIHVAFRTRSGLPDRYGLDALSWLFRDWRAGDATTRFDVRLFDLLAGVQTALSILEDRPVALLLTSGYRTRERNATIEGAAENSQHIHGRAADLLAEAVPPSRLQDVADDAGAPGLGRYASFTHLDVGPDGRRW